MYKKQPKPKLKDTVKMLATNLKLNIKAVLKGDRGTFKKFHNNSSEVNYCKEYQIDTKV